jgi:heptosyltransferase-3
MLPPVDWSRVRRVLVVRLRSIGDTVLSTPSLTALREFLPQAEIDILLEEWVSPLLEGFPDANVVTIGDSTGSRFGTARELRRRKYDVAFNLHGGTTATFLTFASGAPRRVGFRNYQYSFLHTDLVGSPSDFWKRDRLHSVEQQLALIGSAGVPVTTDLRTKLAVVPSAVRSLESKLTGLSESPFALFHPVAAFATKQWATDKFALVADHLALKGIRTIAIATSAEREVLDRLSASSRTEIAIADDLTLPEITALASKAALFVGNDSGVAHIAAAMGTPSVVIFGSSNRDHWRPWTDAPNEIVYEGFKCQPCPGHECKEFGEPSCILNINAERVIEVVERVAGS